MDTFLVLLICGFGIFIAVTLRNSIHSSSFYWKIESKIREYPIAIAFLIFAIFFGYSQHIDDKAQNRNNDNIEQQAKDRKEARAFFCRSEHQEQIDLRNEILDGYKLILGEDRKFLNDPNNTLIKRATEESTKDLIGYAGNERITPKCPQHYLPEDQRDWTQALKDEAKRLEKIESDKRKQVRN